MAWHKLCFGYFQLRFEHEEGTIHRNESKFKLVSMSALSLACFVGITNARTYYRLSTMFKHSS